MNSYNVSKNEYSSNSPKQIGCFIMCEHSLSFPSLPYLYFLGEISACNYFLKLINQTRKTNALFATVFASCETKTLQRTQAKIVAAFDKLVSITNINCTVY